MEVFGPLRRACGGAFSLRFAAASPDDDTRRYKRPQAEEIAVVFESVDGAPRSSRDIVVWPVGEEACRVSDRNERVDPLTYPFALSARRAGMARTPRARSGQF